MPKTRLTKFWDKILFDLKNQLAIHANWFCLCLIIVTCLNSFFWLNEQKNSTGQTGQIEVRILQPTLNKSKFANQYLARDNTGNSWIIESKEFLETGYEYKIDDQKRFFVLNNPECEKKQEEEIQNLENEKNLKITQIQEQIELCKNLQNYQISTGLIGIIKTKSYDLLNGECNYICNFLRQSQSIRINLRIHFDNMICKDLNFWNNIFGFRCSDILAWSYGLVLGQGDLFTSTTKKQLQKMGITHLVVISGFQVGLMFSSLEFLGIKLRLTKKLRVILGLLSVLFLVLIVGFQAPVLRSGIGILIGSVLITWTGRRLEMWRNLLYSGILLLWIFPHFLVSYSFWLSFVASWALVVVSSKEDEILETIWLKNLSSLLWSCLSTFLFTIPLVINLSGQLSWLAILPNLILIPVIPFITFLNLLTFVPIIGEIFGSLTIILQSLIQQMVVDLSTILPTIKVDKFSLQEIIIYWILLSFGLSFVKSHSHKNHKKYSGESEFRYKTF
jgi:ComEC/Rec2-related protein